MSEIKIHAKYDVLRNPNELLDNPKNPNRHDKSQIDRLAQIYEYQGIRHPIVVSKRSGYIVAGHGRKQAAIKAKIKEFPVVYQDFDSDEAEYSFMVSDNSISLWAELDLSIINFEVPNLGPMDIDMLGIKNFTIEPIEKYFEQEKKEEQNDIERIFCKNCGTEIL